MGLESEIDFFIEKKGLVHLVWLLPCDLVILGSISPMGLPVPLSLLRDLYSF